jgi:glucosyl-dolichyl phosphate glucuronosyltransferase
VDIVICTYNNAVLLDRVLNTIASQQVSPNYKWSVIVVDNNCTDETSTIVDRYIEAKIIPNLCRIVEKKQGLTHARICGVKNSTREWIAFVDDDCLLAENWVEQAIKFTSSHPNCGAFGGKVILDWEIAPSPIIAKHARGFAAHDLGNTQQRLYRNNFHIPGAGLVVQKTALEKSGWLDKQLLNDREGTKLSSGGDSEIVLRILNAGYELWFTPDCLLNHFVPIRRISETYLANMMYGFGMSAPYIATLRWNNSYFTWLIVSVLRIFKGLIKTGTLYFVALIQPHTKIETLIMWNWTKGQIDSLTSAAYKYQKNKNVL